MPAPRIAPEPAPLALLRAAATFLPPRLVERIASAVMRRLQERHPRLARQLAELPPASVVVAPDDLPYRFVLRFGGAPARLALTAGPAPAADASIAGDVRTLVDLLEGRIDSDTLFFRRDLIIQGSTEVVVGLRNVLDREELHLAGELGALCGPLRVPAHAVARSLERLLGRVGARGAAVHRRLHPRAEQATDLEAGIGRCRDELKALTARLAALEARQARREARAP